MQIQRQNIKFYAVSVIHDLQLLRARTCSAVDVHTTRGVKNLDGWGGGCFNCCTLVEVGLKGVSPAVYV